MADKQGNGQSLPRYFFDLTALSASMAGSFGEVMVPQGNVASGATDSGNPVKVAGVYNATLPTLTNGQRGDIQLDARGQPRVHVVGVANTGVDGVANLVVSVENSTSHGGTVALLTMAGYKFNGTTFDRDTKPSSTARLLSAAASTNGTNVKASAGNVFKIRGENTNAAKRYLKLYNKATAPTVGTDTPVLTFVLAPTAQFEIDLGDTGHYFATGIGYGLSTAAADADTGTLTAGDVQCLNITYS